ncbi:extracellular matrix regulator RemB [Thermincola ferriacetica]
MFLHLGGDVIIPKEEIIAIIDMQSAKKAENNKEFIDQAENEELIFEITKKSKAKSFIVTSNNVFFSPISSLTLKKRSEENLGIE